MFETYQVPAFHLAFEAALCLMSLGRNCGTILNIGDGCTYVASFWESYTPLHSVKRHDFGGKDLTRYLQHLLYKKGYSFTTSSELEIVREIKEQLCSLTPHKNSQTILEPTLGREKKFKLPDGTNVTIDQEQHACPETLFVPDGVFNRSRESIADMVHNSVMACELSTRRDIYNSILLCGGSTFFPGLRERLHAELVERKCWGNEASVRIRVIDTPERKYHVWIGGSIQASLSTFMRCWITKKEYEEYGPQILLRKCKWWLIGVYATVVSLFYSDLIGICGIVSVNNTTCATFLELNKFYAKKKGNFCNFMSIHGLNFIFVRFKDLLYGNM